MTLLTASIIGVVVELIIGLAWYLWYALALSVVFPKLGSPSWKGWVPIVNEAEILVRGGVPAWSVVYYFIPLVQIYGLYLKITATHRINQQFGRGAGSTVLAILLPPVWATLLAWGKQPPSEFDQRVASVLPAGSDAGVGPLASPRAPSAPSGPPPARDASGYVIPPPAHANVPEQPTAVAAEVAAKPIVALAPAPPPVAAAPPVSAAVPEPPTVAAERPAAPAGFIVNPWAKPETDESVPRTPVPTPAPAPDADSDDTADRPPAVIVSVLPTLSSAFTEPQAATSAPAREANESGNNIDGDGDGDGDSDSDDQDDDEYAATVVVDRRPRVSWSLHLDSGKSFALTSDRVALGRNPASDDPDTQLLPLPDSTRTLSKTHATLTLTDGQWTVTDLNSTNGVVVVGDDDAETLLAPGRSSLVPGRFILGKVGMSVGFAGGGDA